MSGAVLAIDIGSNTIKCLLGRVENGAVARLYERTLDRRIMGSGALVPNAAGVVSDSVSLFMREAAAFAPAFKTVAVATSALRDSPRRGEITAAVAENTGVEIRVLSGGEEARLSFSGAMGDPLIDASKKCAYFDLGGGSMEIVAGQNGVVKCARSLNVGAVRLMRECASPDGYFERARAEFAASLADFPKTELLVGAGGAVVAARFMKAKLGLSGAENEISLDDIEKCYAAVLPLSVGGRVEKFGISAGRADIIPAAFACIIELMRSLGKTRLTHTFCNIRYGIVRAESAS